MADPQDSTPYSTVKPYMGTLDSWVNDYDAQRLGAYKTYQDMYWSEEAAFKLIRRNEDGAPLYVPRPKMIVDTTAHYLLKGMTVGVEDPVASAELVEFLDNFCKRERFYSRFQVAKLAGVTRGDWVFHMTANPAKPEGSRISLNSIDPACYFPEFDSDDLEKRTGAKVIEHTVSPDDPNKVVIKVLRYWHELDSEGEILPEVWREEAFWEVEDWDVPSKAKKIKDTLPRATLPLDITTIPLYHFKNAEWDGYDFGNSELKGYERIFQAINQAISDEEISLALVGLGVYATDAGRPTDDRGNEVDWVVAPGTVWEMPGATMVKRLEGISSVTPVMDHLGYLDDALMSSSGTSKAAIGDVDVQTAESGIALALKFIPTLAKIEYRDTAGVEILTQMWYDWKWWVKAFEGKDFTATPIIITLGEKLPLNRSKRIEELNNMMDRKVISKAYYRSEMEKLGYSFPTTIAQDILDEQAAEMENVMLHSPQEQQGDAKSDALDGKKAEKPNIPGPGGRKVGAGDTIPRTNQSNNKARTNESNGSEVRK